MKNLFKNLKFRFSTSSKEVEILDKNDIRILNTALHEYLENRIYDMESINIDEQLSARQTDELTWFFSGLDTQKKLKTLAALPKG